MKEYYYQLCVQHIGKPVEIKLHDGNVHTGVIKRVDPETVYLMPIQSGEERIFPFLGGTLLGLGLGSIAGFGLAPGFYGAPYYGYGYGYGYGLPPYGPVVW
ncbi:hypothetical protein WD019_18450 [Fictibacillus sp. Mic-4]|uniref:hypothetical protein n=1 Tax=Fictibacillus TaxID=1329200 RepID=UPI000404E7AD|nr:hypothetical protein [Fictibacillus gelatini]